MRGELEAYGAGLEDKPEILCLNKADALSEDEREEKRKALAKAAGKRKKVHIISGVTGEGITAILHLVADAIAAANAQEKAKAEEPEEEGWRP